MDISSKKDQAANKAESMLYGLSLDSVLDHLHHVQKKFNDYEFPKVSVIIPTYNCSQAIETTLESVLFQSYPDFEIVIVDGESTDRTLEVIKSYRDERIKIYSVTSNQRYEMLNKGISLADGRYLNFLFPGDFYIYRETLRSIMSLALDHQKPHLVFCGTLLRDGRSEVKILYRHLTLNLLRKGQQPTSLQSCLFKSDVFSEIGKFNVSFGLRGGFDLMCRFCLHGNLRAVSTGCVFTDYDLRLVTRSMIIRHFWETMLTIYNYFGVLATLRWLLLQKDIWRFTKLWARSLRLAFLGR